MYAAMMSPNQPALTAAQVHANVLQVLDRAHRFSKELDSYGPEYGSEGAAAAFATASLIAERNPPLPDEGAEAWCERVRELVRTAYRDQDRMMVDEPREPIPARFEAIFMISTRP
jgi:hypothetical protein